MPQHLSCCNPDAEGPRSSQDGLLQIDMIAGVQALSGLILT